MARVKKISSLSDLAEPASADLIPIVDVSDTSEAGTGTTKHVSVSALLAGAGGGGDGGGMLLSLADSAARNALDHDLRTEGMLVYLPSSQIYYQLLPEPWTDTDSDWIVFSALNPYAIPAFIAFNLIEHGEILAAGTTISGNVTFTWAISPSDNVAAGSITIKDAVTNTVLLVNSNNDGTQSVALPLAVTHIAGGSHTWRITGLNTKGAEFSRDLTISWVAVGDRTFYVRTNGSDANNGSADNAGGAFLTIQKAADSVIPGDTVFIRPGTYAGFVLGWGGAINGAEDHPIWFRGEAGTSINHRNGKTFDAIDVEGCSYIKITGLTITNDGTVTRAGIRVSASGYGNVISDNSVTGSGRFGIITGFLRGFTISGNTVTGILAQGGQGTGHGIYSANGGDDGDIVDNTVTDCAGDAIHTNGDTSQGGTGVQTNLRISRNTLGGCNTQQGGAAINCDGILNSILENNLIYAEHSAGIALYAIDASAASTGNVVANNTILLATDSPKWCLRLANGSAGNLVFNNIFWHGGTLGAIAADADSYPVSDYNAVINKYEVGTLTTWRTVTGQDANSFLITDIAAIFTNLAADDYSLSASGLAINAGTATFHGQAAPAVDILGNARPFAVSFDVGAYESQVASVLITDVSPDNLATNAAVAVNITFTFLQDVDPDSIVFTLEGEVSGAVAGVLTYDSGSKTATFNPTASLAEGEIFTATIAEAEAGAVTLLSPYVWTFTTTGSYRLFGNDYIPPVDSASDPDPITIGLLFFSTVACTITKIWFYKGATNTGTHTVKVWQPPGPGTLLASKVATGESASGWQSVTLDTPIALAPDTLCIVSVHYPNGRYSFDSTIHTKSNSPLFTGDVVSGTFHPSLFIPGNAYPTSNSDNFYGIDVEVRA